MSVSQSESPQSFSPGSKACHELIQSLRQIGQTHVMEYLQSSPDPKIFDALHAVEVFYSQAGGLLGYQKMCDALLDPQDIAHACHEWILPEVVNIHEENDQVQAAIDAGIEMTEYLAEIFVVGGSAERMGLKSEKNQEPIPAAAFPFMGKPLIAHLIEDLQAREDLFFKTTQRKITIPIALMCSDETNNFKKICELLEQNHYFNRPKDSFIFIRQPMVPCINSLGQWSFTPQQGLELKPSGHGALWNACRSQKIFERLEEMNKHYALIRQINNPLASVDYNILAFLGLMRQKNKQFGFLVTQRKKGHAEGAIAYAIVERDGKPYKIATNVEYCRLENASLSEDFPSNTNVLAVDLKAIQKAIQANPYPGALLNFKEKNGLATARLELSMQNLSDAFLDENLEPGQEHRAVLLVHQERRKAISAIKKIQEGREEKNETPLKAFYDLFILHESLFSERGCMRFPEWDHTFSTLMHTPPYLFFFSKRLGPHMAEVAKKIQQVEIQPKSYLSIDASNVIMMKTSIRGTLIIEDRSSDHSGIVQMRDCTVSNLGADWDQFDPMFAQPLAGHQQMKIILHSHAKVILEGSCFNGDVCIEAKPDETIWMKNNVRQPIGKYNSH